MSERIEVLQRQLLWDKDDIRIANEFLGGSSRWSHCFKNFAGEIVVQLRDAVLFAESSPLVVLISYNTRAGHLKIRQGTGTGLENREIKDIFNGDMYQLDEEKGHVYVKAFCEEIVRRVYSGESQSDIVNKPPDMNKIVEDILSMKRRGV